MKIHFNSIGIITNVQTDEDSLRQGSVGTVLETTFEGINNNYYSAKLNFSRSDGSGISSVAMLWDSENTETFKFVFYDPWFFALAGATTITVFLYDSKGKVIANGQYRFYIEPTDYNEETTITINQFNALMTALAGKVGVPTKSVFVSELPEKGESGVFYVVREGENKNNIYVYNANTEDYVWVGTNDLNLDNYTTKEEQETFEEEIHSDIEKIRNQVINPFIVVDTTASLPTTEQERLYVVVETGKWYYWDGKAYVEGGQFLNINEAKNLENGQGENSLQQKGNYAGGDNSFAIGVGSDAYGKGSFASGIHTYAVSTGQAVFGKYNKGSDDTIFEIGNGTEWEQRNAFEVYKDGHAEVQKVGTTDNSVITKGYVDPQILEIKNALYGTILAVENQNYVNVGWGIFDRANGYPIVNNQKAQITSVKGRTLVKNQLQKISTQPTFTDADTGLTITNNNDGTITISGTILATKAGSISITKGADLATYNNRVYLTNLHNSSPYLSFRIAGQNNATFDAGVASKIWTSTADRPNNSTLYMAVIGGVGETINITIRPQTIDLKKMGIDYITSVAEFNNLTRDWLFGTFDAGTIKPTNFFEINKKGFNKFDGVLEIGAISGQGVNSTNASVIRTKNYIEVTCGETYSFNTDLPTPSGVFIYEYDRNQNFISFKSSNTKTFSVSGSTFYIRLTIPQGTTVGTIPQNKTCLHLGQQSGIYKPYNADTVNVFDIDHIPTLQGIGTAQDEKTLTQDKIVISGVDLEKLNYAYQGDGLFNSTTPIEAVGTNTATPANLLCVKYTSGSYYDVTNKSVDKQITFNKNNKLLYIMDRDYTDVATFKQSLSGQKLYFERSMPIILRKYYTAKVDLGTLTYLANQVSYGGISTSLQNIIKKPSVYNVTANILCSKYETATEEKISTTQNAICITTGGNIIINDTNLIGKTNAETQAYLSGIYLYYETSEKVSAPLPEIGLGEIIIDDVERLGTFNINGECIADFEFAHVAYKPAGE